MLKKLALMVVIVFATSFASAQNIFTCSSTLTSGYIPSASAAHCIGNSQLDDGVTVANTLTYAGSGGIQATQFQTNGTTYGLIGLKGNASAPTLPSGVAGFLGPAGSVTAYWFQFPTSAPTGAGTLAFGAPSGGVAQLQFVNGTQTIASGSLALATSAIASASCQTVTQGSVNSATATGTATTDTISFTPNASIKAVTGYTPSTSGGLTITAYPTSGFVNFDVCNWTSASITPGAVTLNWRVTR